MLAWENDRQLIDSAIRLIGRTRAEVAEAKAKVEQSRRALEQSRKLLQQRRLMDRLDNLRRI